MKIEKINDKSGKDICNTDDMHRVIANSSFQRNKEYPNRQVGEKHKLIIYENMLHNFQASNLKQNIQNTRSQINLSVFAYQINT